MCDICDVCVYASLCVYESVLCLDQMGMSSYCILTLLFSFLQAAALCVKGFGAFFRLGTAEMEKKKLC